MKRMILILLCSMGSAFGMHQALTDDQVKGVLAHCNELKRCIPFFDTEYEYNTSVETMQRVLARLNEGVAYCREMSAQLDADGRRKMVQDVAACRRNLERAAQTLRDYIHYVQNPVHAQHPAGSSQKKGRCVVQYGDE